MVDPEHDTSVIRSVRNLGASGGAAQAGAATQSFNQGGIGGFGHPGGFGGGFGGSAANVIKTRIFWNLFYNLNYETA